MAKRTDHFDDFSIAVGSIGRTGRRLNGGVALYLVLQGVISAEINGVECRMERDSCFCVNNGDICGLAGEAQNVILAIRFSLGFLKKECPDLLKYSYVCEEAKGEPYALLKKSLSDTAFSYLSGAQASGLLFKSSLFKTLELLFRYFRVGENRCPSGEEVPDGRLQKVLEHIQNHYKDQIHLSDLASREFMSVQYLSKLFHQKIGVSPTRYISGLRLDSAVHDLVCTGDGITQVALNNGFPNVKAFNSQFKKQYGILPSEYRKKNRQSPVRKEELFQFTELKKGESFDLLAKYLNVFPQESGNARLVPLSLDMSGGGVSPFSRCETILRVGNFEQFLRWDVREEILAAVNQIPFCYAYFRHFFHTPAKNGMEFNVFDMTDCIETFRFLAQHRLSPFIRIDLCEILRMAEEMNPAGNPYLAKSRELMKADLIGEVCRQLAMLLSEIYRECADRTLPPWKFELAGPAEEFPACYGAVRNAVLDSTEGAQVGIHLEAENHWEKEPSSFWNGISEDEPAFVSFDMDLNSITSPADAGNFSGVCRSQVNNTANHIRRVFQSSFEYTPSLYLIDWNVLTGKTLVEAGEFHRSALIADQLAQAAACLDGVCMPLNLLDPGAKGAELFTHNISLFLYKTIKRHLFFLADFFSCFGERLVYRDEHVICTSSGSPRTVYTILLINTHYMDPFESLDNLRAKTYSCSLRLSCMNIVPGLYRIKKTVLDRDNGGLYLKLIKGRCSHAINVDNYDEYLENSVYPEVAFYEKKIDGEFVLNQELLLNGVAFYVLKKLD